MWTSLSHPESPIFLSPPSVWPLPMMCIFPSAPASQTDSLPRQGSNFQNKTFSTKENITMGRKTFQYQASWDLRKCTECLSENDAVLTSQTSLRAKGEQCLAGSWLQPSQNGLCKVQADAQVGRVKGASNIMPRSRPHCSMINMLDKGRSMFAPISISHLLFHPKGDAH